jgi:hypothetical protein
LSINFIRRHHLKINLRLVGRHEKGPSPKNDCQEKIWRPVNKIGHQMVPSVTTGFEVITTPVPVPQFFSSRQGGIPLTSGLQDGLEDALVKTIQKQLVLDLLVVLIAGTGIQLTEKGQHS